MTRDFPPPRRLAAALFAAVGLLAGVAHVVASDADSLRLWREVLPLACLVGAVMGACLRPIGWRAGALAALLATPGFALERDRLSWNRRGIPLWSEM